MHIFEGVRVGASFGPTLRRMTDMSPETCADLSEDFNAFKLSAAVTPSDRQFNVTLKMKTPVAECGGEQVCSS